LIFKDFLAGVRKFNRLRQAKNKLNLTEFLSKK
jgi:hypothetical protein